MVRLFEVVLNDSCVLPYDSGVLQYDNGVLLYDKGVLLCDTGVCSEREGAGLGNTLVLLRVAAYAKRCASRRAKIVYCPALSCYVPGGTADDVLVCLMKDSIIKCLVDHVDGGHRGHVVLSVLLTQLRLVTCMSNYRVIFLYVLNYWAMLRGCVAWGGVLFLEPSWGQEAGMYRARSTVCKL